MAPDQDEQPPYYPEEIEYTREQRVTMNRKARDAAVKEWRDDPNRKDPKHAQDRMDSAVHSLRVRMGLEKD